MSEVPIATMMDFQPLNQNLFFSTNLENAVLKLENDRLNLRVKQLEMLIGDVMPEVDCSTENIEQITTNLPRSFYTELTFVVCQKSNRVWVDFWQTTQCSNNGSNFFTSS